MHRAARMGNLKKIKSLINDNIDVNQVDDIYGRSALHYAAQSGFIDIVKYLIEVNANVTVNDNKLNTALHYASYNNHIEIVMLLLEYNVDVNSVNETGTTALYEASCKGNSDVIVYLINHNANIDLTNNNKNSALMMSVYYNHISTTQLLLASGADTSLVTNQGKNCLDYARTEKEQDNLKKLIKARDCELIFTFAELCEIGSNDCQSIFYSKIKPLKDDDDNKDDDDDYANNNNNNNNNNNKVLRRRPKQVRRLYDKHLLWDIYQYLRQI